MTSDEGIWSKVWARFSRVNRTSEEKKKAGAKNGMSKEGKEVKVYLNGKMVSLSEATKRMKIPLTKTSRKMLSKLVEQREPVSLKQLAFELKRTRMTIYRSIKVMESRGLVLRIRRSLVALTEDGYKTVKGSEESEGEEV